MIDDLFKVWLIEINTNPCLEQSAPLLSRIIPSNNILLLFKIKKMDINYKVVIILYFGISSSPPPLPFFPLSNIFSLFI